MADVFGFDDELDYGVVVGAGAGVHSADVGVLVADDGGELLQHAGAVVAEDGETDGIGLRRVVFSSAARDHSTGSGGRDS